MISIVIYLRTGDKGVTLAAEELHGNLFSDEDLTAMSLRYNPFHKPTRALTQGFSWAPLQCKEQGQAAWWPQSFLPAPLQPSTFSSTQKRLWGKTAPVARRWLCSNLCSPLPRSCAVPRGLLQPRESSTARAILTCILFLGFLLIRWQSGFLQCLASVSQKIRPQQDLTQIKKKPWLGRLFSTAGTGTMQLRRAFCFVNSS